MLSLVLGLGACTPECAGPACAQAWPATRLVVASFEGLDGVRPVLGLPDRLEGARADGAGWSVAAWGDRLVIGMPERSSVVIARRPVGIEPMTDAVQVRWDRPRGERFGAAVAVVDGADGPQVWVGAPGADAAAGAVYRFPLDAADGEGWELRIPGPYAGDRFGERLEACADLDGDGRPELAVGAPWFSAPDPAVWALDPPPPRLAGAVFLLRGEAVATAAVDAPPWTLGPVWWGAEAGDGVGHALACAHDLTGDGQPDLVLGAPFAGPGDAGRVHLRGPDDPSGPLQADDPRALLPGPEEAGWFGMAVVTGRFDGAVELVVGAPGAAAGQGRVAVYAALDAPPEAVFPNPRPVEDHHGRWLAVGDLDGDGQDELLVGAPDWREARDRGERTRFDSGRLWVWSGATRYRWPRDADLVVRGTQPFLRVGRAMAVADLDGDGRAELLQPVRAPDPSAR